MKNKIKIPGIIAIVALIGFTMAACDTATDPGDPGTGTVTQPRFFPIAFQGTETGAGEFAIDFEDLNLPIRNEETLAVRWDDFMIRLPDFPDVDFTAFSRVTIRATAFDADGEEFPPDNDLIMVTIMYDLEGDWRGPDLGPGPNTPLKQFNVGGPAGNVHTEEGVPISLTQAPGGILFQNLILDVSYIEVLEVTFHNRAADFIWVLVDDSSGDGTSTAEAEEIAVNGIPAFRFTGNLEVHPRGWYAVAGFRFDPTLNEVAALEYLRKMTRVSFMVRGDGRSYRIQLRTPDVGQELGWAMFRYYFDTVDGEAKRVTIPVADFARPNWAINEHGDAELRQDLVNALDWLAIAEAHEFEETGGPFEFTIWDIRLYY